jgi:hypothetical protein
VSSKEFLEVVKCLATSASCGSEGSGEQRRDWSEMRVDLRVRTGDQASFRMSV